MARMLMATALLSLALGCGTITNTAPAPLTAFEVGLARAAFALSSAQSGGGELPDVVPGPSDSCNCCGSGKSGDGIGPCPCVANGRTCNCTGNQAADAADASQPASEAGAASLEALGPDRVVILHATWCKACPAVLSSAMKGLSHMVAKQQHGWSFGDSESSMFQFVDADQEPELVSAIGGRVEGELALPFIGMIENGEIVRTWQPGCSEPLDQWTLGWLYKGVNERPTPPPAAKATVPTNGNYPVRGGWWNVEGNSRPSKSFLVNHLLGGEHRGKFPANWLDSLSYAELMSLHSDDHEERVRSGFVGGYAAATQQRTVVRQPARTTQILSYQSCPTGRCPVRHSRRIGRRRR